MGHPSESENLILRHCVHGPLLRLARTAAATAGFMANPYKCSVMFVGERIVGGVVNQDPLFPAPPAPPAPPVPPLPSG
jgi:hypothetical protein